MSDRGNGRPHKGVDIFVPAGTAVSSPSRARVIRVVDGRTEPPDSPKGRAGLWVDLEDLDERRIHRLLHLGSSVVKPGDKLSVGAPIGTVAEPNTSGLGSTPHLHYEIRAWGTPQDAYGAEVDPRYELADSLATRAKLTIPGMIRALGTEKYGDPKWVTVDRQVNRVWSTSDPDRRLIEARAAAGAAADASGLPSVWGEVYNQAKAPVEGAKFTATEVVVPAAKDAAAAAKQAVGSLWNELPTWAKVAGGVGLAATVLGAFNKR